MRVLDTDTCVEILRGNQRVLERRAAIRDGLATTWITAAELYYGVIFLIFCMNSFGILFQPFCEMSNAPTE